MFIAFQTLEIYLVVTLGMNVLLNGWLQLNNGCGKQVIIPTPTITIQEQCVPWLDNILCIVSCIF